MPATIHEVVQRIDRADHACAPFLARPGLDRGEDRHDEQAARGGKEKELERHSQAERSSVKNSPSGTSRLAGAKPLVDEPDVDRQRRHDEEQERRGRKLDASARQRRRRERAGGDADGEERG